MKTFDQCCKEVSIEHGLGTSLVTGHAAKYWKEAAELYAQEVAKDAWERACEAQRDIFEDVYGPEINHIGKPLYQPSKFDQPNQEKP